MEKRVSPSQMRVVALGEVLWDVFGEERHLGGAPFNFTYHCHAFGAGSQIVTRVGEDELGHEILSRAAQLAVPGELIQVDEQHPTGTVEVTLDASGVPSYVICEQVAWDYIELPEEARAAVRRADILCFGSLAQRSSVSRNSIGQALQLARAEALRVFDINLRQHYFSREVLAESLKLANLLKLNDQELDMLRAMFALPGDAAEAVAKLASIFGLDTVVLTLGAEGAHAWSHGKHAQTPGVRVEVRDTVGSGDAFAAVFALHLAAGWPLEEALQLANLGGAYVATQSGATPAIGAKLLAGFRPQ